MTPYYKLFTGNGLIFNFCLDRLLLKKSYHYQAVNYSGMLMSLDEHRTKLINKILLACSQEEVKQYIDAEVTALGYNKVNKHIIARFTDTMISEPDLFGPIKKGAQQWSNIIMAGILFNCIKQQLTAITM